MRFGILAGVTGTALALMMAPAEAAWHGYFSKEAGFSFTAPGDIKSEKASYSSALAGERNAVVFRSMEDNVEYKVTVADFAGRASDEAALIKEASSTFLGGKKVLADNDARVDSSYGRKLTVDLPNNGGRSMGAIYFKEGRLIQLQVTVLPANGDYESPDPGRFIDSVAFFDSRVDPGATELKLSD
jgi:hypothetical protein